MIKDKIENTAVISMDITIGTPMMTPRIFHTYTLMSCNISSIVKYLL